MESLSPIADESDIDIDRATSWFEFLLDPSKLDKHVELFKVLFQLEKLKDGTLRNPSSYDLIKVFLKQALHSAPKRAQLLTTFAVKVLNSLS